MLLLLSSTVLFVVSPRAVFAQPPQIDLGGHPVGAAFDFSNHDIYIADNGYVLVFNPSANSIVKNITTGGSLAYIAYDNATSDLFITNSSNLVVISGSNSTVVGKVPTPGFDPYGIVAGNGAVYVTGSLTLGGGMLKVIDTRSLKVVANVTLPSSFPGIPAYDPIENRIYVPDYTANGGYGNQTSVVSLSTNAIVANITTPNGPFFAGYGFGKVFVTEATASAVEIIDPVTDTVTGHLNTGFAPDGVAFASGSFPLIGVSSYGTGGTGLTNFFDPFTDEVVDVFTTPNGPQFIIYDHFLEAFFVLQYDGYMQEYADSEIETTSTTGASSTTSTPTSSAPTTTTTTISTTTSSSSSTTTTGGTSISPTTQSTETSSSSSVSQTSTTSSQSTTSEGGGGLGTLEYIGIGVALALALLFGWLFYNGNLTGGKKPPEQPPVVPPVVAVAAKKEQKTTYAYEASMHSDATGHTGGAGHAWGDLRVTKTVTEDGTVVSTEVTEYTYDFAPAGANVFYTDGEVVASKRTTTGGGDGGGLSGEGNIYISITEEGFNAAKAWAESTVTKDGGRTRKPPGKPPGYRVLWYNCVDYTIELCKRAGVDISDYDQSGPSTPSNLVAKIRQKTCKHEWEEKTIYHMGTGDGMAPPPTHIWVCKLCGLTRPAGGG
jgi:hypothetical protein